ncbi:MAG: dihydrolipoyllysine-residue succinyltransferase component of 2-oxoglutarate dehydrogenase complex [Alphaproteobacteria bacterium]|nr:MAG: dihydrolipoyllysine-residue succinyltransferase component of 2-oxoglutarate dehydrogenase complex [Alphaproteobacteria bacterium]
MSNLDVTVPSLGESITEAVIAKWLKKEGEIVNKDEVIAELETDKVTQEIYSPKTGIIKKIFFQEGEEVKIGETIVNIEEKNIDEQKIEEKEVKNSNVSGEQNKIIVPSLGESISEALISKWMKSAGENVKKGEPIVELETDKVTQELYAESSGVLKEILFNEQEEVKIGETIGVIDLIEHETEDSNDGSDLVNTNEFTKGIKEEKENEKNLDPTKIKRTSLNNKIGVNDLREFIQDVSLSPSARKFINESKNEINNLNTIATNGRVTKESFSNLKLDSGLNAFSANENILSNSTDVSKPLSKMRQSIAHRLKEAQNTAAMLTTFNEIDMGNVISLRAKYKDYFLKKYDTKLGFMSFFTKACISVLKEIPEVNAEIKNNNIIYKNRYDIGIAVGTDKGLVVPVLRNADKMNFAEIESSIVEYGNLAKNNKITIEHMKDGTFTISNGGVYGSMLSTPILNPPQSGILGLHNIVKRPVVVENEIVIRPVMYVALTYDHRIIDGKQAVTFLVRLKQIIENPEEMIFEK